MTLVRALPNQPGSIRLLPTFIATLAAALFLTMQPVQSESFNNAFAYDPEAEVDVELVLAVDISQSMDTEEQQVQRTGYVAALTSDEVMQAIRFGPIGRIAISYVEWGGDGEHFIIADWHVIQDKASAEAFASLIAEAPLRQVQRTSISSALKQASNMIESNRYQGLRRVIDISGDGPNNQGELVTRSRDTTLARGITINGLPLMMRDNNSAWYHMPDLDHYYEDCVIGGPGAFAIPVRSREAFADAIRMKLVLEIANLVPAGPRVIPAQARKSVACNLFN
ncbi:MAG: DUF1194 domain-containing protein [Stappiaceae bacterium]